MTLDEACESLLGAEMEYLAVTPYREPPTTLTVAEQLREETDRAQNREFQERVDNLISAMGHRARKGLSEITWPHGGYTSKTNCDELAEALDEKGFTCVVRPTHRRWWRDPPPEEAVWEVLVSW